ncbi:MAG: hypothetical protein AAF658_18775, partial [Myxococcota bacterium]
TDLAEPEAADALAAAADEIAQTHIPVALLVRDPSLDLLRGASVNDREDAFLRAAVELVDRERREAVSMLRARGFAALDSSMKSIALDALDVYMRARAGAAW